ncbi:MAG: 2-dehydro-3-deoxygalactonokinase [Pirellulales bacterium]
MNHVRLDRQLRLGDDALPFAFMTGELFDVLGQHSILKHSLVDPAAANAAAELRAGVRHGRSIPLAAALFRVRTRQLLDKAPGASNRAFLSGVLLGSELAYLSGARSAGLPLVLCATAPLEAPYRAALDELGLTERLTLVPPADVELLSARGQAVLWRNVAGF